MGYNSRLDDLHASVLSVKLKQVPTWSDRRREIAAQYTEALDDLDGIKLPYEVPGYRHVYHLYVIEVDDRDEMLQYLNDRGIDAKTHYPIAIHQQEGYPWGKDAEEAPSLPLSERSAARVISLPMYPELAQDEIDHVIETVRAWKG
jgi:dTDP-4-amino-4,6-dideoxygalactose transaminase